MWRRAWGWVGAGDRWSRIRRTSRGVRRLPRRLRNSGVGRRLGADQRWRDRVANQRRSAVDRGLAERAPAAAWTPLPHTRTDPWSRSRSSGRSAAELGDPQTAAVEELEHGVVAGADAGSSSATAAGGSSSSVGRARRRVSTRGRRPSARGRAEAGGRIGRRSRPGGGASRSSGAARTPCGRSTCGRSRAVGQVGEVAAQLDALDLLGTVEPEPAGPRRRRPAMSRR